MVKIDNGGRTTISLPNGWNAISTDGHKWEYLFKAEDVKVKSTEKPMFKVIEEIDERYADEFAIRMKMIAMEIDKYLQ